MKARTLIGRANEPRDAAGLAAFRVLLGLVLCGAMIRYLTTGFAAQFYVERSFHFSYWGFDWVRPLPGPWMIATFVVLAIAAGCVAAGLFYRVATIVFFVGFTYVHLLDVSNYLNHYYLVSILAGLACVLPLHRAWSLDAWLRPSIRVATLPAWMTWLLRSQVGLVYFFAGLAKLGPDWLLHGQPLGIWLAARTDLPVIGPFLDEHAVALAMSWAGFLFDLTIAGWLSWRRSRPFAYATVCVFHFFTYVFFDIGIFPFVMTVAATVFFDPDWPRWVVAKLRRAPLAPLPESRGASPLGRAGALAIGAWLAFQIAMPLRTHLYGGDVLWHEQGMRWSWRVMVREKNGDVRYRVRMDGDPRERIVSPWEYLDLHQHGEFATQPDLVLQLAHRIAADLRASGHHDVEVRADAWASLNGRRSARLIDPDVDLARVDDGVMPAAWILPAPDGPPIRLQSRREHRLAALTTHE